MKTLLPHTIGLAVPLPLISAFQRTLVFSLHSRGGVAVEEVPLFSGPRHWCQESAGVWACPIVSAKIEKMGRNKVVSFFMGASILNSALAIDIRERKGGFLDGAIVEVKRSRDGDTEPNGARKLDRAPRGKVGGSSARGFTLSCRIRSTVIPVKGLIAIAYGKE